MSQTTDPGPRAPYAGNPAVNEDADAVRRVALSILERTKPNMVNQMAAEARVALIDTLRDGRGPEGIAVDGFVPLLVGDADTRLWLTLRVATVGKPLIGPKPDAVTLPRDVAATARDVLTYLVDGQLVRLPMTPETAPRALDEVLRER